MTTMTIECPMCGRTDTITGEAPHGRTLPQIHGWQLRIDVHICGGCAGTDEAHAAMTLFTLDDGRALDLPEGDSK